MKQITISKITYERLKKYSFAHEYHIADAIENINGTVLLTVRNDVYEGLELLGDDLEQSIIKILNNNETTKNV